MTFSKNIAIFIDGTTNTPHGSSATNIPQLYRAARNVTYGIQQCVRYFPGVGTESPSRVRRYYKDIIERAQLQPEWEILPTKIRRIIGMTSGFGTSLNIKSAYSFLCENYNRFSKTSEGRHGDSIYLFGFSRGAFAARSLAGFVDKVGVLLKDHIEFVEIAYSIYKHPREDIRLCLEEFLYSLTGVPGTNGDNDLPVYFIGVFDTVSAIGGVKLNSGRRRGNIGFHTMKLPSNVNYARQALALHEFRNIFEPEIWDDFSDNHRQDVKQVWFSGAHSDVGGGYPRIERDLSNRALDWLRREAENYGLRFNTNELPNLKDSSSITRVHDSYKGAFKMQAPKLRDCLTSFEVERSADMLSSFSIHPSALERITGDLPPFYPKSVYPDSIIRKLKSADEATIRFQCFLFDKNVKPDINPSMPDGWWKVVTRDNARELIQMVSSYLDGEYAPKTSENIEISQAMVVLSALNLEKEILAKIWAICASVISPENPTAGLLTNKTICELFSSYSDDVNVMAIKWLEKSHPEIYTLSSIDRCDTTIDIIRDVFRNSKAYKNSTQLEAISLVVQSTFLSNETPMDFSFDSDICKI